MSQSKSLSQKVVNVGVVLNNINLEDLKTGFPELGYDDGAFNEGRVLYNESLALMEKKKTADAALKLANTKLNEAVTQAKTYYQRQIDIARIALDSATTSISNLGITGKRGRSYAAWTNEAKGFYACALKPEMLTLLAKLGVTEAKLNDGLFLVNALETTYAERENRRGLAHVATVERDEKCAQLFKWYKDFKRVAILVLGKQSQQLERFGILVYSPNYRPPAEEPETPTTPPTPNSPIPNKRNTEYNLDNPAAE